MYQTVLSLTMSEVKQHRYGTGYVRLNEINIIENQPNLVTV